MTHNDHHFRYTAGAKFEHETCTKDGDDSGTVDAKYGNGTSIERSTSTTYADALGSGHIMKHIIESKLPEDQKIVLLEHLTQRYQGLTKQMKSKTTVAPPVVLAPPTELVPATPSTSSTGEGTASTSKIPRPVARSELKRKQDKPVQEETPLFSGKPVFLETPLSTLERKKKKRKARTPMVA